MKAILSCCSHPLYFPLVASDLGVTKFYLKSKIDSAVHAVVIDRLTLNVNCNSGDIINGCYLADSLSADARVAMEDGINEVTLTRHQIKQLCPTPQRAAENDGKIEKRVTCEIKYSHSVLAILREAFANSPLCNVVVERKSESPSGIVEFGCYVWDGFTPKFKSFDLTEHKLIDLTEWGWKFRNNDFENVGKCYKTEDECRKANSIKVYDFTF